MHRKAIELRSAHAKFLGLLFNTVDMYGVRQWGSKNAVIRALQYDPAAEVAVSDDDDLQHANLVPPTFFFSYSG
jgi:hypothetical protein